MGYIKIKDTTFGALIEDNRTFVIPEYQREFEWDDDNFMSMAAEIFEVKNIDKIISNINSEEPMNFSNVAETKDYRNEQLFLGNIVMHKNNIVDGQQRITSLMIIMKAIEEVFESHAKDEVIYPYISFLKENLLYAKAGTMLPLVKTKVISQENRNLKFLQGELNNKFKLSKLKNKMKDELSEFDDMKLNWIAFKILNIQFIELKVDTLEESFEIFEKLNSKSTPLKPADLIKNRAMGKLNKEKIQEKEIKAIIGEIYSNLSDKEDKSMLDPTTFYRSVLMMDNAIQKEDETDVYIVKNKIFDEFKNLNKEETKHKIEFIYDVSKVYKKYFVDNNVSQIQYIPMARRFLDYSKTTVFSNITLYLTTRLELNTIQDINEWYKMVKWLENLFLGMFTLFNNASKEVDKIIPKLMHRLQKIENLTYNEFKDLAFKMLSPEFKEYEEKNNNKRTFYERIHTKSFKNKQASHLLEKLFDEVDVAEDNKINKTELIANKAIQEFYSSVEHLMPQNISKWINDIKDDSKDLLNDTEDFSNITKENKLHSYIYSIGNMFLLPVEVNSSLGNDTFEDKKTKLNEKTFSNSKKLINTLLFIEEDIEDISKWRTKLIKKRAQIIFNFYDKHKLLEL